MIRAALWLSLACVVLAASAPVSAATSEPVGKVDALSGTVTVERDGRSLQAKAGDSVFLLDKWRTRAESGVEILFLDNSRVKMAPDTTLEITEYLYNPSQKSRETLLSMASGKARFLVQDLQDFKEKRFRVRTQTAVVGTRDTDYIVSVKPEAQKDELCKEALTEALCIENAILMSNGELPDNRVILTANMLSRICGTDRPATPRFATAEERSRLMRGVEKIGSKMEAVAGPQTAAGEEAQTLPPDSPSGDIQIPPPSVPVHPTLPPPTIPAEIGDSGPGLHVPPPFIPANPKQPQPPPPPQPPQGR
jgi:hypothetical protein